MRLKTFLSEAKIDDFRATYVASGKITQRVFDKLTTIDAPPYTFIPYLVKRTLEGIPFATLSQFMTSFAKVKHNLPNKDINSYTSIGDMKIIINKAKLAATNKELNDINDVEKIVDSEGIKVFWIKTKEAAIRYGKGTKWCIAAEYSRNHWGSYESSNNLFYFLLDGSKPEGDPLAKIAIQVKIAIHTERVKAGEKGPDGQPKKPKETVEVAYTYWNTLDDPIQYQLRKDIKTILQKRATVETVREMQSHKDDVKKKAETLSKQAAALSTKEQKLLSVAQYLEAGQDVPRVSEHNDIVDMRHTTIVSLRNIKACKELLVSNNPNLVSLGQLQNVSVLGDFRNCPKIAEFRNLKHVKEAYIDVNTSKALVEHLQTIGSEIVTI